MEISIIQLILTLFNISFCIWQYKEENYKVAIFNGFAAGMCFVGFLNSIS